MRILQQIVTLLVVGNALCVCIADDSKQIVATESPSSARIFSGLFDSKSLSELPSPAFLAPPTARRSPPPRSATTGYRTVPLSIDGTL